jgi:hypothetical protein
LSNRIKSNDIQIGKSYVLPIEQSNVTLSQAKVKKIFEETEQNGSYEIKIAAQSNPLIDELVMSKLNDGIDLYVEYLKSGVAQDLSALKKMKNKIIISVLLSLALCVICYTASRVVMLPVITPTNGLILEINDEDALHDDGVSPSLFYGKEIKEYYMDFDGDDETLYCVMYEDESPFYN